LWSAVAKADTTDITKIPINDDNKLQNAWKNGTGVSPIVSTIE